MAEADSKDNKPKAEAKVNDVAAAPSPENDSKVEAQENAAAGGQQTADKVRFDSSVLLITITFNLEEFLINIGFHCGTINVVVFFFLTSLSAACDRQCLTTTHGGEKSRTFDTWN